MSRSGRLALRAIVWFGMALGGVTLLLIALIGGLLWWSLPPSIQHVAIPGLSAPVSITFDRDGVPLIRARNERDAAAALGFVHARDRGFQMDLMRRAGSGRLAELAGSAALPFDREMRVLGLRVRAEREAASLSAADRAVLESYARGVNAWIAARGRFSAPEFIVLGRPEKWTVTDTMLWAKLIGLYLSGNWERELTRLALSKTLPLSRIAELWPDPAHRALTGPPVDPGLADAAEAVMQALPHAPGVSDLPGGSNAWAVSGAHSASGGPLLAGDPHLLYMLPGMWYLARVERPDGVWAGATAAGVPGIIMGHNPSIAWAFTTTGADTQDVFVERPAGLGMYATPDGPRSFATRTERIHVRGAPDEALTVRETRHGPLISDLRPQPADTLLSVAMASLAPGDTTASGFLALNRARSVAAAGVAATMISAPVQNMIVADRAHIGLFLTGRVPIRHAGDGRMPVDGADGANDWVGFASGEQLPHAVDPPSGILVNANEPVGPPDFPIFMGSDPQGPWRARRIDALLAAAGRRTVAEFARMQVDAGSEYARELLPVLRTAPLPDELARRALAQLAGWDGTMAKDLAAPLIFNAWLERFRDDVLRRAGVPVGSIAVSRLGFVAWLLAPGTDGAAAERAWWCGGDCGKMLATALAEASADLARRLGADPAHWRWDSVHDAVFDHPVLRFIPLIGRWVGARVPVPGDTTTINRQEALFGGFDSVHGAAYRGDYDLADLDRSRFMTVPGQSGNVLSSTARVFVKRWAMGQTITLGPEPADETPRATIVLTPAR
jgi:penicillin G amidase